MNAQIKLGDHFICDLSDCNRELLFNSDRAIALFSSIVRESGLTVVSEDSYKFNPHGFTCFLLLAESHASLHAWPEYGYCAIDLFTCDLQMDIKPLIEQLKEQFGASYCDVRLIDRMAKVAEVIQTS